MPKTMAIVKATYTKSREAAKASVRYIQHRPGKDGAKTSRTLFNSDGLIGRWQAYRIIDEAEKGNLFFRFVISPDPKSEDSDKDLFLQEITEQTMLSLEERLNREVQWVAVEHNDHAPHRHVHVLAVVQDRLQIPDFQAMRKAATQRALFQRQERDLARNEQEREREEAQWTSGY